MAIKQVVVMGTIARYEPPTSSFEQIQINNWLKNIDQMSGFTTLPISDVPGARARSPEMRPAGVPITGAVYSSARTRGRSVGQDITIRGYISMMRNKRSLQYSVDLEAEGFPYGRAFAGFVCSNIFRNPFGWSYTPTTKLIAQNYTDWGFTLADPFFTVQDVRVGDCVIKWPNGGHIEGVYAKTATTITLFDQTYDGPEFKTYTYAEFMAYAASRNYALIRFDYANTEISYTPDPFSPIQGEAVVPLPHDDVVSVDAGYGANYNLGQTVNININSSSVTNFTIRRGGVVIETGVTSGDENVARTYAVAGDYEVSCTMTGGGESEPTRFQVGKMECTLSAATVSAGAPFTVTLDSENCTPHSILLEDAGNYSISNGFIHRITDAERAAGEVILSHSRTGNWRVRPRAEHQGGVVYPAALNDYLLTIN